MKTSNESSNIIIKFSDAFAGSLTKVYKVGKLGLVFIFIGLLMVVIAQFIKNNLSNATFWVGVFLLVVSFILFLIQQFRSPLGQKNVTFGNDTVDNIQKLSVDLVDLTANLQSFSLKYVNDIYLFVSNGLPYIEKMPFIPDNIKHAGIKLADINNLIVDYTNQSKNLISEIKTALVKADLKKLKIYVKDVQELNSKMILLLKTN